MRNKLLLCAAALAANAMVFAAPAATAQEYGYGYRNVSYDESVEVTVPRYRPQRSPLGAPYRYVSMSRPVCVGDLDLRTRHDTRVLRNRLSVTARSLCRQLNTRFPVTAPGSPGCYTTAMNDAMYQADIAIAQARGERLDRY